MKQIQTKQIQTNSRKEFLLLFIYL